MRMLDIVSPLTLDYSWRNPSTDSRLTTEISALETCDTRCPQGLHVKLTTEGITHGIDDRYDKAKD